MEEWRLIPGSKGYQVSNLGNIRNRHGKLLRKIQRVPGSYVSADINYYDGRFKGTKIHRLVAAAFLGLDLKNKKIQVHHKNKIRYDNKLTNLELTTNRKNMMDRILSSRDLIAQIIQLHEEGSSLEDIWAHFKC